MEGACTEGKQLAREALNLAVHRVTNDNTVTYLKWCAASWICCILAGAVVLRLWRPSDLVVAALFGATGAMLSVATRLRDFKLKPCQQSNMNYLMSASRIATGFVSGPLLLLLTSTILTEQMKVLAPMGWRGAAVLGLIGGFAERLIPNLLERTIGQIEPQAGTPVQAFRSESEAPKPAPS
jgi:hypothetical protein